MNNQKYKCKKCGEVFSNEGVDFKVEGSEVGKLEDGTSILDPAVHKDCGGSIDKLEQTSNHSQ